MPKIPKKRGENAVHRRRIAPRRGRKAEAARALIDRAHLYGLNEALELLSKPEVNYAGFNQTVELSVKLGVDPRKSDQMVRGALVLPQGLGKTSRIVVFAKGEKANEATAAGADFVGGEDLVEKIRTEGWLDFDSAIATPDMMRHVGKIGKILGPRGLMPSPKVGTVTFDVANAVSEAKAGKVEFRVDKAGIVHSPVGKINFGAEKLEDNILTLVATLLRLKPSTSKGTYMQKVSISLTQSPGVRLDTAALQAAARGK